MSQLPPFVDHRWHYPILRVTSANLSVDGITSGGYGPFFASVSGNHRHHLVEFSATHPYLGTNVNGREAVFGRSIIAGLWTTETSGSLSVSIAKATFDVNSNRLHVETDGFSDYATKTLKQLTGGPLDVDSARHFGQGIAESIQWVVDNASSIEDSAKPGPIFTPKSEPPDDWRTLCYALGRIAAHETLEEALATLDARRSRGRAKAFHAGVVDAVVAATYHRFGLSSSSDKPNTAQAKRADDLLKGVGTVPPANEAKNGFEVAVLPYLSPTGAILSLRHFAEDARIRAHDWPPAPDDLGQAHQELGNADLKIAATLDLGLQGIADLRSKDDAQLAAYHAYSTYQRTALEDTILLSETYAAGIRVSIRYLGTDDQLSATAVAAKVTLNEITASFSIDVLGVEVESLPSIGAFIAASTSAFDANAMSLLGCVWAETNAVIVNHDAPNPDPEILEAWKPCLAAVEIDLGARELQQKAGRCGAVAFAFRHLADGVPQATALAAAPAEYQAEVKQIYETYGATSDPAAGARYVLRCGL
ncbi:Hypothetical protein A7982_06305 [Minicystis rosea]|nr:Hypothetical protein A7982_06305 [Minicystis rosea]